MINNKGYVLLPLILFFLIIITLTVIFFKQDLAGSVNQALMVQGLIDRAYYNYSKKVANSVNEFKLITYGNLSNNSLVSDFNESVGGVIISNDPVIPLCIVGEEYAQDLVNITYPSTNVSVNISYPISGLLLADESFNPVVIQDCLDESDCSDNRAFFNHVMAECISVNIEGFSLRNSTVPVLIGSTVYVDLEFSGDGVLALFPFKLGRFSFDC